MEVTRKEHSTKAQVKSEKWNTIPFLQNPHRRKKSGNAKRRRLSLTSLCALVPLCEAYFW
jgi:hypothetical protein